MVTINECHANLVQIAQEMSKETGYPITATMVKSMANEELRIKYIYVAHYIDEDDNEVTVLAKYRADKTLAIQTVPW